MFSTVSTLTLVCECDFLSLCIYMVRYVTEWRPVLLARASWDRLQHPVTLHGKSGIEDRGMYKLALWETLFRNISPFNNSNQ